MPPPRQQKLSTCLPPFPKDFYRPLPRTLKGQEQASVMVPSSWPSFFSRWYLHSFLHEKTLTGCPWPVAGSLGIAGFPGLGPWVLVLLCPQPAVPMPACFQQASTGLCLPFVCHYGALILSAKPSEALFFFFFSFSVQGAHSSTYQVGACSRVVVSGGLPC